MRQSVIQCKGYSDSNLKRYEEELLFPGIQRCATPDTKNHKKPPFRGGQKCVETYSSSNAAARNPEERVQINKLEHFTIDYLRKLFKQHVTEKRKASEDKD